MKFQWNPFIGFGVMLRTRFISDGRTYSLNYSCGVYYMWGSWSPMGFERKPHKYAVYRFCPHNVNLYVWTDKRNGVFCSFVLWTDNHSVKFLGCNNDNPSYGVLGPTESSEIGCLWGAPRKWKKTPHACTVRVNHPTTYTDGERTDGRTDGQTDGQGDSNIAPTTLVVGV